MKVKMRNLIPFLVSLAILAVLVYNTNIGQVAAIIASADMSYILLGIIATVSIMLLRAVRWKMFLDAYRLKIKFIDIASSFLASQFLANFTPGRVGEASRPYFLKKRYKVSFFHLLPPVIVERFLDLIVLLILSAIFFIAYSSFASNVLKVVLVLTAVILIVLILVILKKAVAMKLMGLFFKTFSFIKAVRKLKPKINKIASNFFKGVGTLKFARLGPITAITFLTWILESAILYFSVLALVPGANISFIYAIGFLCLAMLGGVVSSLPGGIGSVEAILFAFFLLMHLSAPLSLSIVILYRFVSFFISTIFFTIFFIREARA